MKITKLLVAMLAITTLVGSAATAQTTRILVELNGTAPTAFAPVGAVFHDGSFNNFGVGQNLSGSGLETLAEVGSPTDYLAEAPSSANTGTNGSPTGPGLSDSFFIDVDSTNTNFSFASMVLFSNDWFVGNQTSLDVTSLLDGSAASIVFDLENVYDAGTEVEDFTGVGGSAFFPFTTSGALGIDVPDGAVTLVDRSTNPYLDSFTNVNNLDLNGFDPASLEGFTAENLGNITLTVVAVPEPSTASFLALAGIVTFVRRRR